jgi:hypothetical protein
MYHSRVYRLVRSHKTIHLNVNLYPNTFNTVQCVELVSTVLTNAINLLLNHISQNLSMSDVHVSSHGPLEQCRDRVRLPISSHVLKFYQKNMPIAQVARQQRKQ